MGKTKYINKKLITVIACVITYILLHLCIAVCDRNDISIFNGVIMACQFAVLIFMISRDSKRGFVVSISLVAASMISMTSALFTRNTLTPIPGMCISFTFILMIFMISKQFEMRKKESITDMLTQLSNRRGLFDYLGNKIAANDEFYIIYIDLGNFKFINDNYGHICGDYIMMQLASRMKQNIKDKGFCSRIGGDEFVIVLNGDNDPKFIAEELMNELSAKISVPMEDTDLDCYITCYAGISSFPKDADNYEDLLKYADTAMYHALHSKKNEKVYFFNQEMHQKLNRRVEVEKMIKSALDYNQFYLVYQPQYSLYGKKLRGFEALIRMKDDNGKNISPGEFIPVAEKGDLILSIDDFVLKRAMNDFKDTILNNNPSLTLSINISAKNIGLLGFVDKVKRILDETGFPAKNLEIELTEYCILESLDDAVQNITSLREMGVQIALDDFGTGYSSLSYLANLPINLLKIDKSLVDNIENNSKSSEFVNTVISLGHQMGCEVISEGVENEEQLQILKLDNCDFVQGFVWSKPLDLSSAIELTTDKAS